MSAQSVTIGTTSAGKLGVNLRRLIETRLLIQANSGGGKSYLIRKLLEETHGQVQQVVLDMEGEFSTLREKFDYVLAGKGGDISADPRTAELLARKVLELDTSLIVDLYELKKPDRIRFVKNFCEALVNAPKDLWHPLLIVIDEAHVFVPEKGESEAMGAVVDLATRGRKRGFAVALATQRLSKLNKDVAAECLNKFIGRTSLDIDRKRAGDELGFLGLKDSLTLRALKPGQFYAFGPAIADEVQLMQVAEVKTSHPKAGQRLGHRMTRPTDHVKKILAKLSDLPKEAEEEFRDREQMRVRIRELEREVKKAPAPKVDEAALEKAAARGRAEAAKQMKQAQQMIKTIQTHLSKAMAAADVVLSSEAAFASDLVRDAAANVAEAARILPKPPRALRVVSDSTGDSKLGKGERTILKFLAIREGKAFTKSQIGALTGFSPKGGTFGTYLSRLKVAGFIESIGGNQYRLADPARAIAALGHDYHAPDHNALEGWLTRLGGGAKKIYEVLLANPDQEFTKEELGERVNMEPKGGSFGTYLSRLNTLGLLEKTGNGLRLNQDLLQIA